MLMLLDISRAHLHSPLARVVTVTINGVRWGDDFSLSGRRSLVKTTAVLGLNAEMCDVQVALRLHRVLSLYPPGAEGGDERWELEADPRHVEILV